MSQKEIDNITQVFNEEEKTYYLWIFRGEEIIKILKKAPCIICRRNQEEMTFGYFN